MRAAHIKSGADFAAALDLGRNQAQRTISAIKRGEDVTVKKTVALAMSALAQGLKPWDDYDR